MFKEASQADASGRLRLAGIDISIESFVMGAVIHSRSDGDEDLTNNGKSRWWVAWQGYSD